MTDMSMTRKVFFGIVAIALLIGVGGGIIGGRKFLPKTIEMSEREFTYNIKVEIVAVKSVFMSFKDVNPFSYVVVVKVPDNPEIEVLSEAEHVLPIIGPGLHSVPIPDSDLAGYINWVQSDPTPVDSEGVNIRTYVLEEWALGKEIWLSCHETVGSAGHAELTCSEF